MMEKNTTATTNGSFTINQIYEATGKHSIL